MGICHHTNTTGRGEHRITNPDLSAVQNPTGGRRGLRTSAITYREEVSAKMRGINKVILVGNATRDAELRHTSTGKAVSNLRLATNRMAAGVETTQFHTIVCWDTLAETTGTYVKKGDP